LGNLQLKKPVDSSPYSDAVARYVVPSRENPNGREVPVQPIFDVRSRPWGSGRVVYQRINSTDDSDYSEAVPIGKRRKYLSIMAQITTTATVANRALVVQFTPAGGGTYLNYRTATIAASQVGLMVLGPNEAYDTTVRISITSPNTTPNVELNAPLPEIYLNGGDGFRVYDILAGDAAADDMVIVVSYMEWDSED